MKQQPLMLLMILSNIGMGDIMFSDPGSPVVRQLRIIFLLPIRVLLAY